MLPPRGAAKLSREEIIQLGVGTWIEERLNANTVQCRRVEEVAFGRPREIIEILYRGWTRKFRWYANVVVWFAGERAHITLVEGDVRFRIRTEPVDIFDLARFGRAAESSHEVADL